MGFFYGTEEVFYMLLFNLKLTFFRSRRLPSNGSFDVEAEKISIGHVCRHARTRRRRHELPVRREPRPLVARRPR